MQDITEVKIKLCPFCGKTAELHAVTVMTNGSKMAYVRCNSCSAQSGVFMGDTADVDAAQAWNRRECDGQYGT